MNGQCGVVPGRSIRELVVGQQVSSGLRLGQVLELDDRDFGALIEFRRLVAAMAGYDLLVPVDQNRRVEAEGGDIGSGLWASCRTQAWSERRIVDELATQRAGTASLRSPSCSSSTAPRSCISSGRLEQPLEPGA